jgi:hypothetical protein
LDCLVADFSNLRDLKATLGSAEWSYYRYLEKFPKESR